MKKIKSLISILLCICMAFCMSVVANAAAAKLTYSYSGSNATVKSCNAGASGSVKIPSKVTYNSKSYNVKFIGQDAFSGCKYIDTITISNGVTAIKSGAFSNCTSLTDVYVPETLVNCAYDAFDGCENVTVHCYKSNYQFFSVLGFSSNITVDVVDADEYETESDNEEGDDGLLDIEELIGGVTEDDGDFVEIDTSQEGLTQMITRLIQMFVYIFRTYLAK